MFYVFVALCLFGGAFAQVPTFGRCPDVETVKDFNVAKYLGRWYEAERYFSFVEIGASCIEANYSRGENNTINIFNSYKNILGSRKSSEAVARIPDETQSGKLKIKYSSIPINIEGDYWVLGTDYDSYAVVYSCRSLPFPSELTISTKRAWILTRDPNPSDSVITKAIEVAEKNQLRKSSFTKTKQTDCE